MQNDANEHLLSRSLELEERFLCELGWQKPTDEDADFEKWTITDEERRSFVNLVCALNGISIDGTGENGGEGNVFEPTREDIERAAIRWIAHKRRRQQQKQQQQRGSGVSGDRTDVLHEEPKPNANVSAHDSAEDRFSAAQ
jgi:hypothetical protein